MILMHSLRDYDAEKSAARMAVQAAAGALMNVTGHTCNDIVMCSQPREWDDMLEVCFALILLLLNCSLRSSHRACQAANWGISSSHSIVKPDTGSLPRVQCS